MVLLEVIVRTCGRQSLILGVSVRYCSMHECYKLKLVFCLMESHYNLLELLHIVHFNQPNLRYLYSNVYIEQDK